MMDNHFLINWRLLLLASLLSVVSFNAQLLAQDEIPAFNLTVTVNCPGKTSIDLGFKTAAGATIGFDNSFDEPAPPRPIDIPNSFFADIKPASESGYQTLHHVDARPLAYEISWDFTVNIPLGATGSLEWNTSQLQEGWTVTLSRAGQNINMLQQTKLQQLSAGSHNFTLSAEMEGVRKDKAGQFVNIKPGWNLLSPVLLPDEPLPVASEEKAFGLQQGSLQVVSEYIFGRAYWIFNDSDTVIDQWKVPVVEYEGRPLMREPGWNFVGVVENELLVQEGAAVWQWLAEKQGFDSTEEELKAGFGYWVFLPTENDP